MADKPTVATPTDTIPTWATSSTGSIRRVDPGSNADDGYDTNDEPPAGWFNDMFNRIGKWLTWSESQLDENATILQDAVRKSISDTITSTKTFGAAGLIAIAAAKAKTSALINDDRVVSSDQFDKDQLSTSYLLISQTSQDGNDRIARTYLYNKGEIVVVVGAAWDASLERWNPDTSGGAWLYSPSRILEKDVTTAPWTNNGWDRVAEMDVGSGLDDAGATGHGLRTTLVGSKIGEWSNAGTPFASGKNRMIADRMVSAWAKIDLTAGVPTISSQYNVASISRISLGEMQFSTNIAVDDDANADRAAIVATLSAGTTLKSVNASMSGATSGSFSTFNASGNLADLTSGMSFIVIGDNR